jgi:hypothetical protein
MIATFSVWSTFGTVWIDTILQRVWESIRPKETFEWMKKWFSFWDIYSSSYKLAQKEFLGSTSQALSNMTNDLNSTYSCNLSIWDTTSILLTIDSTRNDILAMVNAVQQELTSQNTETLISSCTKLINCATKWWVAKKDLYDYDKQQKQSYLSNEWFVNCKNYATTAYTRNLSTIKTSITLASTNAWSEIYANGTLDDSPYDLLIDIQNIGDILFANNQQTEKTIFYTFPNNSVAWFQAIPFAWGGNNSTPFPSAIQVSGWNKNNNLTQWSLINKNITRPTQSWNTTPKNIVDTTSLSDSSIKNELSKTSLNDESEIIKPIYINTTDTRIDNWIIDNFSCLSPTNNTSISPQTNNSINTISNNIIPSSISQSNQPINTFSINNNSASNTQPPPPTFNTNTPYYSPVVNSSTDPINTVWDFSAPSDYEKSAAAIESCTNKCTSLPAADKAMCIAKCMCGTTSSKDWLFSLSICTIPSKKQDIVSSKPVKSIEEIITEINNVLGNLKDSGQMMKHTKTKGFLDTSLSKIKLHKIFAFDINIAFKPILDNKPRRLQDAVAENESDTLMRWNYSSTDIKNEKNKYATLWNQCKEEKKLSEWKTLADIQATLSNADAACSYNYSIIPNSITQWVVQAQNAAVADIVKDFIEQNARFRTFVNDSLGNVQKTAENIKQKIEKGK